MLKFECMYFLNQLVSILRIQRHFKNIFHVNFFFENTRNQNIRRRVQKNAKSPKICKLAKFYPHENLSTKLAHKYTFENEMKLKNC